VETIVRKSPKRKLSSGDTCDNWQHGLAESAVQKLVTQPVKEDAEIPFILRTLEQAERELQYKDLAFAISAAEFYFRDLLIWHRHSEESSRQSCWKHLGIGAQWVRLLRRQGGTC
jgi:hypothetical protein